MSKSSMCIIRGIGTVLAAGIIVGFVTGKMVCSKRRFKKKTNKAAHAVGDLLDNVHYMFK